MGDCPGKNARLGCHDLLQGIFPTQGSNPGLPYCRQILYCLSHQGSPLDTVSSVQISSVAQSRPTLCDPMNRSTPGLPVHHQLPEFTQTHYHQVNELHQQPVLKCLPCSLGDGPGCQYPLPVCSGLGRAIIDGAGTSLMVQGLGLCASTLGGKGGIPGRGTKILYAEARPKR